ncbi:hypothetical protein HW132_32980 [Brasilonema sp. CT11]|nr:hypothetical protein [Brasilonema sp. CT11]
MSRYHLESSRYADIVIGWDAPLGTYFAQVWNSKDDDEPVLWIGTDLHELASVDALQVALADYCSVPLTHCPLEMGGTFVLRVREMTTQINKNKVPPISYVLDPVMVQEQLLNDKNNDPFTLDRPGLGFLNP